MLKRPVSPHILMDILRHIIQGQALLNDGASLLVSTPMSTPTDSVKETATTQLGNTGGALVVDDDEFVRTSTVRLVSRLVSPVVACENGTKGLAVYRDAKEPLRTVLVDYCMPGMNGVEFTRRLRELEAERGLRRALVIRIFLTIINVRI